MKLLILSNTDQPGRSGVGDFALGLSGALNHRGIDTTLAAIHSDPSQREKHLYDLIKTTQPDWVSLHFVPYAYAHRGLVGKGTLPWTMLRGRVGTHILFHEIWIGAHHGANWRDRVAGFLQRNGIQQMLREYRPTVVHCTNPLYSLMLKSIGIDNSVLPLFGAIPVPPAFSDPYINLFSSFVPKTARSEWVVAALFGNIYPSVNLLPAIQWLNSRCTCQSKKLLIVSLGYAPKAQAQFVELALHFHQETSPFFFVAGKLEASDLSSWIRAADCCLSTTPFDIIEKSSSAVAFVEHGVPVIVMDQGAPIRRVAYRQKDLAPEFWLFGDHRLNSFDCLPPRREPQTRLDRVAKQFIENLNLG